MGRRFESTQRRWMVQHQRRPIDGLLRTASALAVRRKPTPQLQNRLVDIQQNLAASGSLSVTAVSRYYLFLTLFILLYPNTHSKWQWMNQKLTLFYHFILPMGQKERAEHLTETKKWKKYFFFETVGPLKRRRPTERNGRGESVGFSVKVFYAAQIRKGQWRKRGETRWNCQRSSTLNCSSGISWYYVDNVDTFRSLITIRLLPSIVFA